MADPDLQAISAITQRLADLEQQQQVIESRIADLTLQLRDRREQNLSVDEFREVFQNFDEIWDEPEFEERHYAVRLLV